jgi:hypothetical protein
VRPVLIVRLSFNLRAIAGRRTMRRSLHGIGTRASLFQAKSMSLARMARGTRLERELRVVCFPVLRTYVSPGSGLSSILTSGPYKRRASARITFRGVSSAQDFTPSLS